MHKLYTSLLRLQKLEHLSLLCLEDVRMHYTFPVTDQRSDQSLCVCVCLHLCASLSIMVGWFSSEVHVLTILVEF